jgi:lipopolysaccharide export system permease protein
MVVAYHKINEYGESVASLGRIDPMIALWGPFAIFAILIVWMYYRVAFIPGAQAIGALETAFARLMKWFRRFTRRRRRSHQMEMVADAV